MKCFFCAGEAPETLTTHVEKVDECVLVIKSVPCNKCEKCGEVYYNGNVSQVLQRIVGRFKESLSEISVVSYSDTVA